jgi:sialate O-acetylesterase
MVLQRDMPVPVWGTADPGAKVVVSFAGQRVEAAADTDGRWRAVLVPLAAQADPGVLRVEAGGESVEIGNVLVGEVWLGSGQSNMQLPAEPFIKPSPAGAKPVDNSPGDANLRALVEGAPYLQVRLVCTTFNNNSAPPKDIVWQEATRENLLKFSAQLQAMGVQLSQKLDVPVGLILVAVGGSPSGRWIRPEALAADPATAAQITKAAASFDRPAEETKYRDAMTKYETDLAAWEKLPAEQKKTVKQPGQPAAVVAPGEGQRWPVGDLRAAVLDPFVGFAIRGVFWDQGESGTMVRSVDQLAVMRALIASWRTDWGQGEFPWVFVPKPSGGGCAFDPADPVFGWASEPFEPLPETVPNKTPGREVYLHLTKLPNTHLVPNSDLGTGLHPANKFAYGTRALQVILHRVYGRDTPASGPVLRSAAVEEGRIRLRFDHATGGLVTRHGSGLQGFAVAGADRKFSWAEAAIEGDEVLVSSPAVPRPLFVRYAWADQMRWANLFNAAGWPAGSFRTDD